MPLRTSFNTGALVDPANNLSKVLSGLQGQLGDYERQKLAEQRQAALLEQQAAESARAERSLSLREKEYARAKQQDDLLGQALLNIDLNKQQEVTTPATSKEQVVKGVLTPEEQAGIETGRANLEGILADLQQQKAAQQRIDTSFAPSLDKADLYPEAKTWGDVASQVSDYIGLTNLLENGIDLKKGIRGSDAPIGLGERTRTSDVATDNMASPAILERALAKAESTDRVTDDEIEQAKKDLSLYNLAGKQAGVDVAKARATTQTVNLPAKTELKDLSKAEWINKEKKKAKGLGMGGATLSKYLKEVDSAGEILFPKGEKITGTISVTSKDGKRTTTIPYARAQQFLDAGWKVGKPVKGGTSYGDRVSQFAAAMYTAFPEDPNAVESYIKQHGDQIKSMSKDNIKALVAELKAKVAQESAWDIFNWVPTALGGGTDVRDVLLP